MTTLRGNVMQWKERLLQLTFILIETFYLSQVKQTKSNDAEEVKTKKQKTTKQKIKY